MELADRMVVTGCAVLVRRSARARRYRIEIKRDGTAVLTIPARGSEREGRAFLARQAEWLERARERVRTLPRQPQAWTVGSRVLLGGEWLEIQVLAAGSTGAAVSIGGRVFRVGSTDGNLRPVLEAHFRRIACVELVARAWELSAVHGAAVKRVTIRSQRTRWGSCSARGTISLNWRLVQAPAEVADYVIIHELMHTRHMNHSAAFWSAVAAACPRWREAERWLKANGPALGM